MYLPQEEHTINNLRRAVATVPSNLTGI